MVFSPLSGARLLLQYPVVSCLSCSILQCPALSRSVLKYPAASCSTLLQCPAASAAAAAVPGSCGRYECSMPWYDESLTEDLINNNIVEGEEPHSSQISRVRRGDNAGSSGYGPDNFTDLSVGEQDIAMTRYEGGEGANRFCFGLHGLHGLQDRRSGRSGADDGATGGAIVGDDFVTLQLLEDALTKYSATHRRPSAAVRGLRASCTVIQQVHTRV